MIALNSDGAAKNLESHSDNLDPKLAPDILKNSSFPDAPQVGHSDQMERQLSTTKLNEHSFSHDRTNLRINSQDEDQISLDNLANDESGLSDYANDEEELAALLLDQDVEMIPYGPTNTEPGSEEKVRVLISRYAQGHPLWHEGDSSRLEGHNVEEEGLTPRKARPKTMTALTSEERLLQPSSRKERVVKSSQEQLLSIASHQNDSNRPQSRRGTDFLREDSIIQAQAARAPSRSRSDRESIGVMSGGSFDYNPINQTGPEPKRSRYATARPFAVTQTPADTARRRVPVSKPVDLDLRSQYEMLVKGVACGGLARSDLTTFIEKNSQKLLALGIEA